MDGRFYPWGNRFDWSFCKGRNSREGEPQPEAVGAFGMDESPYGIRDMGGSLRELTADAFSSALKVVKGGGWSEPDSAWFRAALVNEDVPTIRLTIKGFRVTRAPGLPSEDF